ncbi:histone-lysine N-methyltransferase ash1 isoform X2 [Drosophila guanche]|uniref:histone-lysine N-methyltransferase ash1 isoform X2 n=1 Tax=Drosophila guanche TaxID=7266 RepID=UPI0014716954|nr:histone-lysine N-methyltransferase ash1 isoform X2 [Drosophila guanche]
MSSGQNETSASAAKVLETQRTQESGSENEETDSITDQSSQSKSAKSATQFSVVQRSDTDGLRMRISAIRPLLPASSKKAPAPVPPPTPAPSQRDHRQSIICKNPLKSRKMSTQDTESGCSEAKNKAASKKIKVKRKKIASGSSGTHNSKTESHAAKAKKRMQSAFSSDSEDDLPLKVHQQRAPRLLLTAISQAAQSASKPLDIGISSSDNDLPNLVQAAIKRVESDTEDTTVEGSFRKAAKSKNLPQYQSTLLQDFMEKTQMLGQTGNSKLAEKQLPKAKEETQLLANVPRKRRGRPKKTPIVVPPSRSSGPAINESADSGVISTTSTTQSTTPSPKMQTENIVPSGTVGAPAAASSNKPKIDMAYLDKRMYATERVLYPSPRNKRRQNNKKTSSSTNKEELQLDPLWREIDVNKKFRLRSVSVGAGAASGAGGASNTICSKILAAKSGYVSDYGSVRHQRSSHNHNSGYKSDASCKSRYSTKSCMSRRSRAKSCGYRSDCKESGKSGMRMRRKRRASMLLKSGAAQDDPTEDQDILLLAGLSLGQSSEESNEYISKPSLQSLPTTSASKKYGEINRYVTTGQYFGRGGGTGSTSGSLATTNPENFISKMMNQRKETPAPSKSSCKIKSRRSSAASMCSSYVSGVSRVRRRHRRKSFSHSKSLNIDSKLLTEIEIITSTFHSRCRIQDDRLTGSSGKEKLLAEATKLQATLAAPNAAAQQLILNGGGSGSGSSAAAALSKPLKRAQKKRKLSEPLVDFAMLSASASASVGGTPNGSASSNGTAKRRHKKSQSNSSSSPDDHKLPLKKRHYLLTPGERPLAEAAFANGKLNAEAWAAAAATAKSTASTKSQAQFNAKSGKSALTPKKRHLLEQPSAAGVAAAASSASNSPLRIVVDNNSISGGKLLDISPSSLCSLKQQRRGGSTKQQKAPHSARDLIQLQSPSGSYPPPGIFEPSVELEIQIPMGKLNESVITKTEAESPLLSALDIKEDTKKEIGQRVVETLLHKTGGNLLLKRKRKKINRTGFPTVKKKKRKVSVEQQPPPQPQQQQQPAVVMDDLPLSMQAMQQADEEPLQSIRETRSSSSAQIPANPLLDCERVPLTGEARETFVARSNQRAPRLSVVALERLQRPQTPAPRGRPRGRKPKDKEVLPVVIVPPPLHVQEEKPPAKKRGRQPKPKLEVEKPAAAPPQVKQPQQPLNNIKLPAGVGLKSCQIRLKRRKNLQASIVDPPQPVPSVTVPVAVPVKVVSLLEMHATQEEIDAAAEAKRLEGIPIEHDPLPISESLHPQPPDNASLSDASEDKASTASTASVSASAAQRKFSKVKKNYLVAGLFSNYYKQSPMPPPVNKVNKKPGALEEQHVTMGGSLLPPPPYCEKYLRQTEMDFELPYDIWWAYTNDKLPTRHIVPSWNYRKIRTNVYAESVRPNLAGFDHPICNCKNQGEKACQDNCLNRMVYTECSPSNCPAAEKCRNQKIQRHEVAPGVERFMTLDKGWGVRTKLPIAKGTYILEYVGEVVTERDFKQRMASIYLNDTHHYCLHLDGGLVIDGQRMGSDCRFVNHSCEPNCEMQKWSVNGLSRMVLFAKRPIEQGEELTYDYNFSLFNPSEGQPCRCNMPQCRGVIGGKSQRVKPLPAVEAKPVESCPGRNGRQRKHKAKKHAQRLSGKESPAAVAVAKAKMQPLSEKEKKLVKQFNAFLIRNFEKIRKFKAKVAAASTSPSHAATNGDGLPGSRPSTPSSTCLLATQISALCTQRNMKTRGLTQAVQDPELDKMAKMAVILRDICNAVEGLKMSELLMTVSSSKKKKSIKNSNGKTHGSSSTPGSAARVEFKLIQAHVEQGHYKTPLEYDLQMLQLFAEAKQQHGDDEGKSKAVQKLLDCYEQQKMASYTQLLEILGDTESLQSFRPKEEAVPVEEKPPEAVEVSPVVLATVPLPAIEASSDEDVIRCICGLYKDEGLMIQCAKCMVWQHTECTKADIDADNYQCERCEPREVDREIPLDEYTEEGHRYYLTLMRGNLQVRQGDAVYVLRDIPIKDAAGNILPSQKHTYETIGAIDYQECDIFRVEHLWKNDEGKRFIFGHHFLRPHETFHEPSRRFYPNEVVRVSLYEVVPIELVIGRCWVLDRTTFCKGRPMECPDEDHCFICELRVDKTARFFSKAKANHPACTKSYAFRKFPEKLKICKSYAPHDVDPSLLKTKKQKTDLEVGGAVPATMHKTSGRQEQQKVGGRKQRGSSAAAAEAMGGATDVHVSAPVAPNGQILEKKRSRLENVLKTVKLKCMDAQTAQEQPIDLSYLWSGRGARQRKTNNNQQQQQPSSNSNSATPSA